MSGTTITSSYGSGIRLSGASQNPVTVDSTGTIATPGGFALYLATGTDWTLTNNGLLYGGSPGLLMPGGGTVINLSQGTIGASGAYADGIQLGGPGTSTVVNAGRIAGPANGVFDPGAAYAYNQAGGTIIGLQGVNLGSGSVNNAGLIDATGNTGGTYGIGINLQTDGFVTNQAGGVITASHIGVDMAANLGTVVNNGTIGAAYYGVARASMVTNQASGVITGGKYGLNLVTSSTVVNAGSIGGTGADAKGILMTSGGYVTNTGVITGSNFGINIAAGAATVTNAGTIGGTTDAVLFSGGDANRMVVDPGAVFLGGVDGGADSTSVLELAAGTGTGTGTLQGLGSQYVDFSQVVVDPGAAWTLAGNNTIGAGVTLDGAITLAAGATLDVAGTVAGGSTISFGGAGATLLLEGTAAMAGAIAGFGSGDTIDLAGVAASKVSYSDGMLDYTAPGGGGVSIPLTLGGIGGVHAVNDGTNGADVVSLCFCAGTLLATPSGELPVERLRVGDAVLTASGTMRRIAWIGVGHVLAARGQRSAATPVVVRKGALADNVPHHDLRVTKGHALWFDGVLIPVEFLVNHRSILWDDRAQEVALYHIELDCHDIVLANGAPAESYRDDGNRWLFQNANSGWDMPPLPPCAPVLTGGPVVDAVWRRLLDRAGPRPGLPVTQDPDLHLRAGGKRIDASWRRGCIHGFRVPQPRSVCVVSRAGVPQELGAARDPRPLGVAVRRILLRRGARIAVITAEDARLSPGFHAYEPDNGWRWTDGDAMLPPDIFAGFGGVVDVELHLGGAMTYPMMPLAA